MLTIGVKFYFISFISVLPNDYVEVSSVSRQKSKRYDFALYT